MALGRRKRILFAPNGAKLHQKVAEFVATSRLPVELVASSGKISASEATSSLLQLQSSLEECYRSAPTPLQPSAAKQFVAGLLIERPPPSFDGLFRRPLSGHFICTISTVWFLLTIHLPSSVISEVPPRP